MNSEVSNTPVARSEDIGGISAQRWWFITTTAVILMIAGGAKLWSAFGNGKLLALDDPIMGIKFVHLMLAAGLAEIAVALFCALTSHKSLGVALVAWMSTNFVVYRLGLWWVGWKKPCSCLGNLTDALHISPQVADNIMKVVLAYLLIGSYWFLFLEWRNHRFATVKTSAAGDTDP